jgi:hypothetical protein
MNETTLSTGRKQILDTYSTYNREFWVLRFFKQNKGYETKFNSTIKTFLPSFLKFCNTIIDASITGFPDRIRLDKFLSGHRYYTLKDYNTTINNSYEDIFNIINGRSVLQLTSSVHELLGIKKSAQSSATDTRPAVYTKKS